MTIQSSTKDDLFNLDLIRSYVDKELNPRFVERDWLKQQVEEKLADPDCRFVLLTAEPGAGKSAFMAWLAHQHSDWCRYFIRRDQRTPLGDVGSYSFLLQVGFQLAATYPDLFKQEQIKIVVEQRIGTAANSEIVGAKIAKMFASPFYEKVIQIQQQVTHSKDTDITGVHIGEFYCTERDLPIENLQFIALLDPAKAMMKQLQEATEHSQCQIVVLVDALDELRYQDSELSLLKWLTNCPELPANLRFVLTCRPDDDLLRVFRGSQQGRIQEISIAEEDPDVEKDLTCYTRFLIETPEVNQALIEMDQGLDQFTHQAVKKANGNFGYLGAIGRAVDEAIRKDQQELLREILKLSELPDTLQDLYAFFLSKIKDAVAKEKVPVEDAEGEIGFVPVWSAVYKPILGILSVALEPLTPTQIYKLSLIQAEFDYVTGAIEKLQQFLDQLGNSYRLYHSTLPEFFTSPKTKERTDYSYCYLDAVKQNQQIVKYYRGRVNSWAEVDLSKVVEDPYGGQHLTHHLIDANCKEELHTLLAIETTDKRNAWFSAKEALGDTSGFISDINLAWREADRDIRQIPSLSIERSCRYALTISSLNSMSKKISPELLHYLIKDNFWSPEQGLSYVIQMPEQEKSLEVLRSLAVCSPATFIARLFDSAKEIRDDLYRAKALSILTTYLPENLKSQALESALQATQNIPNEQARFYYQAYVLASITPCLSDSLKCKAFELAKQISEDRFRADVLTSIGPRLPYPLKDEAVEEALKLIEKLQEEERDELYISTLIKELAPHLSTKLIPQALKVAQAVKDEYYRAGAISAYITCLEVPLQIEILDIAYTSALAVKEVEYRVRALMLLWSFLADEQKQLTLEEIKSIQQESIKSELLVALVPELTSDLIQQALDIIKTFQSNKLIAELAIVVVPYLSYSEIQQVVDLIEKLDSYNAAKVLLASSPYLRDFLVKVFKIAINFNAVDDLAIAMSGLSNYLPEDLRCEVWSLVTQKINALDNWMPTRWFSVDRDTHRALTIENLSNVASNLPDSLKQLIFDKTLELSNNTHREAILVKLLPSLPNSSRKIALQEALKSALAIEDAVYIARLLVEFAPYLDDSFKYEVLNTVNKISDESERTEVLIKLFPYISKKHITHAFSACAAVESESYRTEALTELVPYLPDSLRTEVLTKIQDIESEYKQATALIEMLPSLTESLKSDACELALNAISKMEDKQSLSHSLREVAPHLPESLMVRSFNLVQEIQPESDRLYTIAALMPYLPDLLKEKAYQIGLEINNEKVQIDFLINLIHHLPETLKPEVIQRVFHVASKISESKHRAKSLAQLFPMLSQPLQSKVLEQTLGSTLEIENEIEKIETFSELAHLLPPSLKAEAIGHILATIRNMDDERKKGIALKEICSNLTQHLLRQAFDINTAIINEEYRLIAWGTLVAKLPESILSQAINAALTIKDKVYRTKALRDLISYLPEALAYDVYEVVLSETNSQFRCTILSKLASRLTEPLKSRVMHQCLADIEAFTSENDQIAALAELIPDLPKSLLLRTICLIWSICSEYKRADLLASLIPQLEVLNLEDLSLILQEALHLSARYSRRDLLINLQLLAPIIYASFGTETTARIERVLLDIARWWP
jgi:hypothetical protein